MLQRKKFLYAFCIPNCVVLANDGYAVLSACFMRKSISFVYVVNVLLFQMNRYHLHVSLTNGLSMIFVGLYCTKTKFFFIIRSFFFQRKKFVLLSFLHSESYIAFK